MAYTEQYALAKDEAFLARFEMALLDNALVVMRESVSGNPGHADRARLAQRIIGFPDNMTRDLALVVCANSLTVLTSNSTDIEIRDAIYQCWDGMAGFSATA
jgi:hypothetical protein